MMCGCACFVCVCVSGYPFGLYFNEELPKKEGVHLCFLQLNLRTYRFRDSTVAYPRLPWSSFPGSQHGVVGFVISDIPSFPFLPLFVGFSFQWFGFYPPFVFPACSSISSWAPFLYIWSLSASSFHVVDMLSAGLGIQAVFLPNAV